MNNLTEWYSEVIEHIKRTELKNLSEYEVDGYKPFVTFTDVTRSRKLLKEFSYSDFKHADDLNFISQDLIYAIAIVEITRPNINNAVAEGATYHQRMEDHLYLRYASYAMQTVYSFWDRLGDFLDFFFDTKQKGDVYLSRVIDRFPDQYKGGAFEKFSQLYKNQVLPFLEERHSAVHTFSLKAKYYWGVIEHGNGDIEALSKLQLQKESYPIVLREQLDMMFHGFSLCLALISELPEIIGVE